MRECGTSRGFGGKGEWVVTGGSTVDTHVLLGAGGGKGEGEKVLEQVVLGAVRSLLVHHGRR
jgi:hypothetical protein